MGKLFHESLKDLGSGIGKRINRMPHAVDEAAPVKGFLIHYFFEVGTDLTLVRRITHMLPYVVHHPNDLDVGAAVLRAFQGRESRRDDGIGIGAGGGDHACRKGRVVSAAVLHMEDQGRIENPSLQLRIFLIRTKHIKDVFCCGAVRVGAVDVHAPPQIVVIVGMITVNGQHREDADEAHGLAEHIFHRVIGNPVVVGGQRQHAFRHGVHDILARRFHDDVPGEVLRKSPKLVKLFAEGIEFLPVRKLSHEKKVGHLLKAPVSDAIYQIIDLIAPEPELSVAGNGLSVHHLAGFDL